MTGLRASQVEFALEVGEGDIEVDQGHLGGSMAEQLHQRGEVDTAAEHLASEGVS